MIVIDFTAKSLGCVPEKQWLRLLQIEKKRQTTKTQTKDKTKDELTVVCLGYEDGIEIVTCKANTKFKSTVVHKDKINCKRGVIFYDETLEEWYFVIEDNNGTIFKSKNIGFATYEDVVKAVKACANTDDVYQALDRLSDLFPELSCQINEYKEGFENYLSDL